MNTFAAIFDMDGVLIDSTTINRDSFNAILSAHHLSMNQIEQRTGQDYKGGSLRDLLVAIKQNFDVDFDLDTFSAEAGEYQFKKLQDQPPNKELHRLLNDLRSHNIPIAIATSSLKWRADKILETLHITDYFSVIVTADDVKEHKPNPHIFLEAARRLHIAPEHCVVIEDADSGVEAAKRAGMAVIGLEQFNQSKGTLVQADLVVDSFDALTYEIFAGLAA